MKTDATQFAGLDVISMVKACLTISGEIVLERLLGKLMAIVIENAGAQRGILILEDGSGLRVHVDAQRFGSRPMRPALRRIHTIKGTAGSLGANELHRTAEDLEAAILTGDSESLPSRRRSFCEEMGQVLEALRSLG